jgi:serine/threonine protein kinase
VTNTSPLEERAARAATGAAAPTTAASPLQHDAAAAAAVPVHASTPALVVDPEKKLGRWQLLEQRGSGATSTVLLGVDPTTHELAAVKVFDRSTKPAVVGAKLLKEADCMARVNHPHVVRLLDVLAEPSSSPVSTTSATDDTATGTSTGGITSLESIDTATVSEVPPPGPTSTVIGDSPPPAPPDTLLEVLDTSVLTARLLRCIGMHGICTPDVCNLRYSYSQLNASARALLIVHRLPTSVV